MVELHQGHRGCVEQNGEPIHVWRLNSRDDWINEQEIETPRQTGLAACH
jgi:hypothetical protein